MNIRPGSLEILGWSFKARSHIETELSYPVFRPYNWIVSDSSVLTKIAGHIWAEFLTLGPLYPMSPLPVERSVNEGPTSGRGPFLIWG